MRALFLLAITCSIVYARPQNPADAVITKYDFDNLGPGYSYSWETSDGSRRDEIAEVRNEGQETEYLVVRGSYSYLGPDGVVYTVRYVADENGFQPEGAHLPQSAGVGGGGQLQPLPGPTPPPLAFPPAALASLSGLGVG